MSVDPRQVAILTVHGNTTAYSGQYADAFPWPRLQLDQLRKHTPPGYTVLAYGNDLMPSHEALLRLYPEVQLTTSAQAYMSTLTHVWPARNWLVRRAFRRFRYLLMLDSDAFPIAGGWLDRYAAQLTDDNPVVAIQRLENGDTHSDRSFVLFTAGSFRIHAFDFTSFGVKDAGAAISGDLEKHRFGWTKLNRTNVWNPHPLAAGIYDRHIYHHGAGTRLPRFRGNKELFLDPATRGEEIALHHGLISLLFEDPAAFAAQLEGHAPPVAVAQILERGREAVRLRTG